jgi:type I restriction enzyme R subunit
LILDWCKKHQTRASVKLSIQEILDQLPAVYEKPIYEEKCHLVYGYVYEHY